MNLLVLGGTRFLGRHVVEAAQARGHGVTVFTRGRNAVPWGPQVSALVGDRDVNHGRGDRSVAQVILTSTFENSLVSF